MNAKDLHDVESVVYWLASVRCDLEVLHDGKLLGLSPEAYAAHALRCLGEAEAAIDRIALGVNRR